MGIRSNVSLRIFSAKHSVQITDSRRRVANAMHAFCICQACLLRDICLAYKELLRHTFFQACFLRSISSCLQGANACFQSSMLAESHFVWLTKNQCMLSAKHACSEPFLLAFKELMHAFCQACLPRAIYSCLQGANACLLTSMFAQNYFLFPTWNLDILSTKDACSGDSPRQRRTEACVPANILFRVISPSSKRVGLIASCRHYVVIFNGGRYAAV